MTTIEWHGRSYSVDSTAFADDGIRVTANNHHSVVPDKEAALRWLTSHSLRKSRARELLAAERNRHLADKNAIVMP